MAKANKYRGEVAIDLDRKRVLKFTHNSLVALEESLGVNSYFEWFHTIQSRKTKAIGIKEVRALLWAGLLHEDPDLTLDQAGELMDSAGGREQQDDSVKQYLYLQEKVFAAFFYRVLPAKAREQDIESQLAKLSSEALEDTGDSSSKPPRVTESLASSGT